MTPRQSVTVASQGAAAFVGEVYYLADGRSGDPLVGWPPRPPPVGFRKDDDARRKRVKDANDPEASLSSNAYTSVQKNTERVFLATNERDASRALGELRVSMKRDKAFCATLDANGGETSSMAASSSSSSSHLDVDDAISANLEHLTSVATQNRSNGPSAYFPEKDLAQRWGEVVNRPFGLSHRSFGRRRIRRPSDKPLLVSLTIAGRNVSSAYASLCKGWANPVLAAKRGIGVSASRNDAVALLQMHGDVPYANVAAVVGSNPDVVGDGVANRVAPLLTGYDLFLPYVPFGEEKCYSALREGSNPTPTSNDEVKTVAASPDNGTSELGSGEILLHNAWLSFEVGETSKADDGAPAGFFKVMSGASFPTCGSFRAVSSRLDSGKERIGSDGLVGTGEGGDTDARRDDDAIDFESVLSEAERSKVTSDEAADALVATRAVDQTCVSVGECPRRGGPSNVPVDTPVFSSPLVHVVMPGGGGSGGGDGSTGFVHVDGQGSILPGTVHKKEIETTKDPFPLGVKLAMRGDSGISVTNAQMYRPWFFNLEDLAAMVRAAIKKEASLRVAKNETQRDVTRKALAAMLTAITHTKPNRKLSGFAMPGIEVRKGSSGGSNGTGKPSGGFSLGDDTPDDDLKNDLRNGGHDFDDDDDVSDKNETGLDDDDASDLNDDELMKEYMKEMVKDGSAENALGSWARDAALKAQEAKNFQGGAKDPKHGFQTLDVSPMAHASLIGLVSAYYLWNEVKSWFGTGLDKALLLTEIGRYALVVDSPLADAMDQVEVGTFQGVVSAAVAGAAVHDINDKFKVNTDLRKMALDSCKRRVRELHDEKVKKELFELRVLADARNAHDELISLETKKLLAKHPGLGDDELRGLLWRFDTPRITRETDGHDVVLETSEPVPPTPPPAPNRNKPKRAGGIFRSVPLLRRVPVIGAATRERKPVRDGGNNSNPMEGTWEGKKTQKYGLSELSVPALETQIAEATSRRDLLLRRATLASEETQCVLKKEQLAQMRLLKTLADEVRDNLDALRFADATNVALKGAAEAQLNNRVLFDEKNKPKAKDTDVEGTSTDYFAGGDTTHTSVTVVSSTSVDVLVDGESGKEVTQEQGVDSSARSFEVPPLFVANLRSGATLGDGTQVAGDGSNAVLNGFIGSGKYSHVRRV